MRALGLEAWSRPLGARKEATNMLPNAKASCTDIINSKCKRIIIYFVIRQNVKTHEFKWEYVARRCNLSIFRTASAL